MSLGERIRSGSRWLIFGSVGGQALSFAIGVALARILAPEDFGFLITVQVFTGIAGLFASGGTGEALVRARDLGERDYDAVYTLQTLICCLIYAFFYGLAPWVAVWFDNALYTDLMRVSALSFLIRPLQGLAYVKLRREMRFAPLAVLRFASLLLTGALSIALALAGLGTWALVLSGLAGSVLMLPAVLLTAGWRPRPCLRPAVIRQVWGYGFRVAANELLGYLRLQLPNLILSRALGAWEVGVFNKADSLAMTPKVAISGPVYQPVFRALSTVQDDLRQSRYLYLRATTLLVLYTLPLYLCLYWLASPFIGFVYGPKWMASAPLLEILAFAGALTSLAHAAGAVLAARNLLGREIVIEIGHLLLILAGALIGLRWGMEGVAWAVLVGRVYWCARMLQAACAALGLRLRVLVRALKPVALLNGLLLGALLGVDRLLPEGYESAHPLAYLALVGGGALLVYAAAFLWLPQPSLTSEARRWRVALHLQRGG